MWKPSQSRTTLIVLSSSLAFGILGCNNDAASPPSPPAASAPAKPAASASPVAAVASSAATQPAKSASTAKPKASTATKKTPVNQPIKTGPDTYNEAIDTALGAIAISESAKSRDDWQLVASRWQEAIELMKAVPTSSRNHAIAQKKLPQYQRFLASAQKQAAPPPKPKPIGPAIVNKPFFTVPIKRRQGDTIPVVDVTFDGKKKYEMFLDTGASKTLITRQMAYDLKVKPVGMANVKTANGVAGIYFGFVNSIQLGGNLVKDVLVGIGQPDLDIGLLGHDFYDGYDITIKKDVVEFRRQR
ncbi:retroviral-like aspartic protease family protein [Trichocoleus sp. DQ-A3]|uniref:retropepsin-like aspartic protease family protein n=1 Tax=Cyanophyceae TaxID=3028117 RepID=UPI001686E084|nr:MULTISPECIES: retropepsin-like aspartic protease [unclassified Coleofasciculus]MBD1896966.1 retroviral-like aspartic protease family protein [Coleofasciculus sp. FACHB-129]MBD1901192.1 retroviral-like aspartic protease family protein [Coleofasciculus sp. FACHB-125]